MGGWVTFIGDVKDFESRVKNFKRVFDVPGVPALEVQAHTGPENLRAFSWAWKKDDFPDFYFLSDGSGNSILFSGVLTDMGSCGPLPPSQREAVSRLLELWPEEGERLIGQLNGSFSFLFYEGKGKQASVFTDRFASRSVWFTPEGDTIIFGDYPSAVAAVKKGGVKLNPSGLWSLFHSSRHPGQEGLFSGFRTLLAGQKAEISRGSRVEIENWRERKYKPDSTRSPRDWGHEISEALVASAEKYRRVCESPHLFLSGGLDSRIAAAAFRKPLKAVSLCSSPNAETRVAGLVSKSLGIEHETIIRSPYWYLETLEASALISSGNYFKSHAHFIVPAQIICAEKPNAEFFLGDLIENLNKHYFNMPEDGLTFTPDNVYDVLFSAVPYTLKDENRTGIIFNKDKRESLKHRYIESLKEYARYAAAVSDDPADRLDTFLRWADVSVTPTYNMITCIRPLARERNLFFDNELNELSLEIPARMREGVLHKWILYYLSKKLLLLPDSNTFLPPVFHGRMARATKKVRPVLGKMRRALSRGRNSRPVLKTSGSWLLTHEMYRKDDKYRNRIEGVLANRDIFRPEIFDIQEIENTWKSFLSGNIGLMFEIEALFSFGCLMERIAYEGVDI